MIVQKNEEQFEKVKNKDRDRSKGRDLNLKRKREDKNIEHFDLDDSFGSEKLKNSQNCSEINMKNIDKESS
jgi:hypothetical protein